MIKEREYYHSNYLNKYPASTQRMDKNDIAKPFFVILFDDGHNKYIYDSKSKIIYWYSYDAVGYPNKFLKGTAQYEYILDCYYQDKSINYRIMYDNNDSNNKNNDDDEF